MCVCVCVCVCVWVFICVCVCVCVCVLMSASCTQSPRIQQNRFSSCDMYVSAFGYACVCCVCACEYTRVRGTHQIIVWPHCCPTSSLGWRGAGEQGGQDLEGMQPERESADGGRWRGGRMGVENVQKENPAHSCAAASGPGAPEAMTPGSG